MTTFAVVSVYDSVAETYGRPFCAANNPSAIRSFTAEVNNRESGMLYDRPGDFELVSLGTFNDQTGTFELASPTVIARGLEVKAAEPAV